MNLSKDEESELLDRLSREKAVELIPVSVYVMLMMIVGLCGNIAVCVFYNKRIRTTPTTRLIVAVAVIDTIICILMPKNVIDISLSYKFTSSALCKLNNFVNHSTAISSALVLVAVSAFRFRAVCRPFASQFSLRHANISVAIAVVVSLVISVPVLVTHESVPINITVSSDLKITGYDCNTSKKPSLKPLNLFVNVLHFFIFIVTTTTYLILYGKMGVSILRYYRRKKFLTEGTTTSVRSTSDYTSKSEVDSGSSNYTSDHDKTEVVMCKDNVTDESGVDSATEMVDKAETNTFKERAMNYFENTGDAQKDITLKDNHYIDGEHEDSAADTTKAKERTDTKPTMVTFDKDYTKPEDQAKIKQVNFDKSEEHRISGVAVRQTAMLFIITVIFFMSFLPYLAMNISRTLSKNKDDTDDFTNWIQFCTRSYLINSAANPFVYGLFNSEFRAFVKKKLCRCFR